MVNFETICTDGDSDFSVEKEVLELDENRFEKYKSTIRSFEKKRKFFLISVTFNKAIKKN